MNTYIISSPRTTYETHSYAEALFWSTIPGYIVVNKATNERI